MALTKCKIGELVTISNEKNTKNRELEFYGINKEKVFVPTFANTDGLDGSKYKIMTKGRFVFSGMQTGRDMCLRIGLYNYDFDTLISPAYTTFEVNEEKVLPEYFFMLFKSDEMDRYCAFLTDGSIRANLDWEVFCDIDIELPSIEIQKKYVNVYKAMVANQKAYEKGLDDLKLVCDAIFAKYNKDNMCSIKELITISNKKNTENKLNRKNLRGINEFGEFTTTRDGIKDEKLADYLVIPQNSFAVNFMCLGNFGKFYLALNESEMDYIVSPACQSFTVSEKLNPNYFRYVITRSEFQRRCVFYGDGNTRGGINISDFGEIEIAVPPIEVQNGIATIFAEYDNRRKINNKLKGKIKDLCPILIAGAIKEAKKEV